MSLHTPPSKTLASLKALGAELEDITAQHLYGPDASEDIAQWGTATPLAAATVTGTPITAADVPRKRRPRLAIAASVAVLLIGGSVGARTFQTRQAQFARKVPQNPAGANGSFVIPTLSPQGMCLTNQITFSDANRSDSSVLILESKSGDRISVIRSGVDWSGEVGKAVTVNGEPGFLYDNGEFLVWKNKRQYLTVVSGAPLIPNIEKIARLVTHADNGKLGYDGTDYLPVLETPAHDGYYEQLVFSKCDGERPDTSPFSTSLQLRVDGNTEESDVALSTGTPLTITRVDGSKLKVVRERVDERDSYRWIEGRSFVTVSTRRGRVSDIETFISGLSSSKEKDVRLLKVKSYAGDPERSDAVNWRSDSLTMNGVDVRFKWEARGTAVEFSTAPVPSSENKVSSDASQTPHLTRCNGFPPGSGPFISCAFATSNLVRAVATMPDGVSVSLPLVRDRRSDKLNLFIWARKESDPRPVRVDYFNKAGKIVHTQK
jgi:hypothetical protein